MTAVKVTAVLLQPVVSYSGLHLDGILAHAALERATGGAMLPQSARYVEVAIPLRVLWRNAAGVPLYASTDLLPWVTGWSATDVVWLHRRALEPHQTRANLKTGKGRYKERRSPMPALVTDRLVAYADGDMDEIAALLTRVTSIGKKRAVLGAVREWIVEPVDEFSFTDEAGHALRPIHHLYLYGEERGDGVTLAYSPPYWHVATRAVCVPTGTAI